MSHHIFPFPSLPAELRERIYKYALIHNHHASLSANTSLLLTCKQIHSEAIDILYNLSTLTLTACFHLFDDSLSNSRNHLTTTGDISYLHTGSSTLSSYLEVFPECLLEVGNLVLNVYVDNAMHFGHTELDFKKVNHFLTSFATFLHHGERHSTQTLKLNFFFCGMDASDHVWVEIFYPLAKIPEAMDLSLRGLDEDIREYILDARSEDPIARRDTVGDWLRLRGELMASGEKAWKAKYGVASVDLMVGGEGTTLKEGNDRMLAHAVDIVEVRRRTAEMTLEEQGGEGSGQE